MSAFIIPGHSPLYGETWFLALCMLGGILVGLAIWFLLVRERFERWLWRRWEQDRRWL